MAPLLRLAFGAAAVVCAAASQADCLESVGECAAAAAPVLSQDSLLLQVAHNRSTFELKRHGIQDGSEDNPLGVTEESVPDVEEESYSGAWGYPTSGPTEAPELWCAAKVPPDSWNMKACRYDAPKVQTQIKVLTYNLFWWNLFNQKKGSDRSAGKLIAQTAGDGYDLMGFQECDDRMRVLTDARAEGLKGEWEALDGGHAVALMYRKDRFELLATGKQDVGEDDKKQYYGKRGVVWVRLRHIAAGTTVFYINHHGPLPVNFDAGCAGKATAYNIERVIASNAQQGDLIILTGDFNADPSSSRIKELSKRLHRVYTGTSFGGVDNIFSNCQVNVNTKNLGKGYGQAGSDHDALSATFHL